MAFVIADRVRETTTTTGTGTLSLGGAVSGFRSFVSAIGTGNNTYYVVSDGVNWEVGIGTVTSGAPNTLSRDTVLSNSLGNTTKVSFGAGTKDVAVTLPAGKAIVPENAAAGRTALSLGTAATLNFGTGADDLLKTSAADQRYVQPNTNTTLGNLTVSQLQVTAGAGIGVGAAAPSTSVNLNMSDTFTANANRQGISNVVAISDETLTANRSHFGAYNYLLNRRTATDAFTNATYGAWSAILNGEDNGSGSISNAYGAYNYVLNRASDASYSTIGTAYGAYNYVHQYRTGTITTAYGTYNRLDRDAGTITTAYGVYNSFEGTIGTAWGIYSSGDQKNYLTGDLGLGTSSPERKLHVAGGAMIRAAGSNFVLNDTTSMLEINATTGEANIAFHRTSQAGMKIGLDANNMFSIGGWTWAAGRLTLTSAGLLSVAGSYNAPLGTAAAPTYSFTGDTNTGIYSPAADQVGITTNGTVAAIFNASNQYLAGTLGTAALPIFSFNGDPNTGIYSAAADTLSISCGGGERWRFNASGQALAAALGTAALPVFSFNGDPNTGIYSPGADQLAITTGGSVSVTWAANGQMLLQAAGTNFAQNDGTAAFEIRCATGEATQIFHRVGQVAVKIGLDSNNKFAIGGYSWEPGRLTLDAAGNLVAAGSVSALSIGVLGDIGTFSNVIAGGAFVGKNANTAWVNFQGTGTVAIRDSFNVTSVTDLGTGQYRVNLATNMANTNYAVNVTSSYDGNAGANNSVDETDITVNGFKVNTRGTSTFLDKSYVYVQVMGGK